MSNATTLNVVIVAVASMGQSTILPGTVKKVNPYPYQYVNDSSTNLTEYYHEVSQVQVSEQLVLGLADKLLSNSHDIPTEFNQIISENFWDLV
jgi:hypothetical protein